MPEPIDRKDPMKDDEIETASPGEHADRQEANRERQEREMRDREEADRIEERPRESQKDVQQHRTTDRGTDVGTSEPGVPPRTDTGPTEDSPAREPTERVERMEDASSVEEVERGQR